MTKRVGKTEGSTSFRKRGTKPTELLELGRHKKRVVINKAKDEESLEEIKEYVYAQDTLAEEIIKHNLHNIYDDV